MREEKYQVILDENEHSIMLRCLNDKRTELINQGKYTDAVDDLLVKLPVTCKCRSGKEE